MNANIEKKFYLTFAAGSPKGNGWEEIIAKDEKEARMIAHANYGTNWSFLYDEEQFCRPTVINYFPLGCLRQLILPPDGGRYRLACAEERVSLMKEASATLEDLRHVVDQAKEELQDDWDDALASARRDLETARHYVKRALATLKEGT